MRELAAWPATRQAALTRIAALRPSAYARTRNALNGAVSGLSPYIGHGIVSLPEVLAGVLQAQGPDAELPVQHKFVYELGWRAYFRHVWRQRGDGILHSIHPGPMPESAYARQVPDDVRQARTGLPVIDQAVRTLYTTGLLHNHARMWLASYLVHLRHVHWRTGADWLHSHLLDGDLASNHLSWQWVAGTASRKPYLFNADNVARYAPPHWHSPGTLLDAGYEHLERIARGQRLPEPGTVADTAAARSNITTAITAAGSGQAARNGQPLGLWAADEAAVTEPTVSATPPQPGLASAPDASLVAGRDVWLLHPWALGPLPDLPAGTVVLGLFIDEYHQAWPWSAARWRFVGQRMAELTPLRWQADAATIGAALAGAQRVRAVAEPHLAAWLPRWAECLPAPALFPPVTEPCDSFSQWWTRATRGLQQAADLLAANEVPAC